MQLTLQHFDTAASNVRHANAKAAVFDRAGDPAFGLRSMIGRTASSVSISAVVSSATCPLGRI